MNRSKARGTAWERRVVEFLRARGWPLAERRALHGNHDLGDVVNGPRLLTVEGKNHRALDLAGWLDEAVVEAANCGDGRVGVVFFPRRNHTIDKGYALMRIGDLLNLASIAEAGITTLVRQSPAADASAGDAPGDPSQTEADPLVSLAAPSEA